MISGSTHIRKTGPTLCIGGSSAAVPWNHSIFEKVTMEPVNFFVNHCTLHSRVIKSPKSILWFWLQNGLLIIKIGCNQIEVAILAPKAILQNLQNPPFYLENPSFHKKNPFFWIVFDLKAKHSGALIWFQWKRVP